MHPWTTLLSLWMVMPVGHAYYSRPALLLKTGGSLCDGGDQNPGSPASKARIRQRQRGAAYASTAAPPSPDQKIKLVGASKFKRDNPKSDRFQVLGFHHIEFYCGDATNTCRRFQLGLGMNVVAKSDLSTGNSRFASYCLQSGDLSFVFTAPYQTEGGRSNGDRSKQAQQERRETEIVHPGFDEGSACEFFKAHGVGVRAIGVEVTDATKAYEQCIAHGGQAALAPQRLECEGTAGAMVVSEVRAYGDVVLRFVSREEGFHGPFLPAYKRVPAPVRPLNYGIRVLDHAVGNVWNLIEAIGYLARMTGFHEFAEFTADDVGTMDSGLNSMVLASNNERVLIPINEPTYGTRRKSQIQTYLEYNNGPGLQHLALKTDDIFSTVSMMREATDLGGFEFQDPPNKEYYTNLPQRLGDALTSEQYRLIEELGLLADKDDQGILLQVFTKPVGDRPTLFLEIIQRVGCEEVDPETKETVQRGGCGGFGKGNFKALFESIERYEKALNLNE